MNKDKARLFFIACGILDLVSVVRMFPAAMRWIRNFHFYADLVGFLSVGWIALYFSLIFSGVLLLLGRKSGSILFYFQYPLKLAFMILSFGFVLPWVGYPSQFSYKIAVGIVIGLETIRLLITFMWRGKVRS